MTDYKQIRESLQMAPLSEEEKQKRGILARLYGPCASISDATRNGRFYSDELWEKVFNENELIKEMFENGGCPMEMDHPLGREETDSQRIAAMLPEPPKRDKDGHLICYVDLIDTPCGKIAYQLAKYGFKLGISSRGSGDVLPDDSVDPDTYDFTTFDLVLLPAVKDARLSMCESIDTKSIKLKKALTESYNELTDQKDKEIMAETVKNLNLDVNLDEDIDDDFDMVLPAPASAPITEAKESADEDIEENKIYTIGDLESDIKEFDKELPIEFAPIVIDDKEYPVEMLSFDDSEENKVVINIGYVADDNINDEVVDNSTETAVDEVVEDEVENTPEDVIDDETDEVMENLKEAIRQKGLLENEIKTLKSKQTVSDTEVAKLTEELDKYKAAFTRVSKIAADGRKSESEVKTLTEQLNQKDKEIESLKQSQKTQLNESVVNSKIKTLTESLNASRKEVEEKTTQINNQVKVFKQKLAERTEIAKKYKAKAEQVLTEYINFKAEMLGVRPSEITNKLNENYSISDINNICEGILSSNRMPTMQLGINRQAKAKINEPSKKIDPNSLEAGYEVNDDLLVLAGLKK